jgi:serine/threonine kinase 16
MSFPELTLTRSDATLKINGRQYTIEKLLGEGGFAFVYLIRDQSSGRLFALKKILVTSGQEGVTAAMREVEAYRRFKHKNIIRILDSAVVQDEGGDGKIIYL